ncbi:MAG: outer membrane beta-barrel protein [Gammaproteobacteria bacterium]|nr:outer membrane beta-barrel protein [Gammaproteobacteria bacterium]
MSRYFPMAVIAAALIAWTAGPVQAEGFYVSGELGMNFADAVKTDGHDTDRSSVCDEYINPRFRTVNDTPGWENTNCTGPNRGSDSVWENRFGSDEGVLFGSAVGYHIADSRFRVELEYFYRDTGHDEASEITVGGGQVLSKVVQEIVRAEERIGDVSSHNLFANVYMDFDTGGRFTPYIGVGIGFGFTELEYSGVFARDVDPARITTGNAPAGGRALPNAAQIQQNLAGTTTTESEDLDDTLFGYQLLFGVDYTLTDSLLLGVKGRWVSYDSFKDKDEWDQLRSHPSNLRQDGGETVVYDIKTDDIELFGVSLNLKYRF